MNEPPLQNENRREGEDEPQVGDTVFVTVLRGPVPATVLAVRGDRMLVEYELGTYSALRVVPVADPGSLDYRPLSYHGCPRHWLAAIIAADMSWIGLPRGSSAPAPTPAELLAMWDAERDGSNVQSTPPG